MHEYESTDPADGSEIVCHGWQSPPAMADCRVSDLQSDGHRTLFLVSVQAFEVTMRDLAG